MSIIRPLPKDIADKIAAGEVVERPLSIVKELIENALDAASRSITVEIRKGGKEYIRVSDNGMGIAEDQIELAFKRYATSKVYTDEDLNSISTLGFRGEALASIASVARVELVSKPKDQKTGKRIVINGGIIEAIEPAACQDGTTIVVSDLFFNIPARRKFLKADNVETALISEFISKEAIAYPNVKFRYQNGSTILFSTLGNGSLKQAIQTVYDPRISTGLLPVAFKIESRGMELLGYISPPMNSLSSRRYQIFFVNGRLVRSKMLENAVSKAYSDKLFEGRYPAAFLFLKLRPETIDVNIHPAKTEIRFYQEQDVSDFVNECLRRSLLNPSAAEVKAPRTSEAAFRQEGTAASGQTASPASKLASGQTASPAFKPTSTKTAAQTARPAESSPSNTAADIQKQYPAPQISFKPGQLSLTQEEKEGPAYVNVTQSNSFFSNLRKQRDDRAKASETQVQEDLGIEAPAGMLRFSSLEYLGSVFSTYLLTRDKASMYIIDQHAAHERILYEELMRRFKGAGSDSQILLIPYVIRLQPAVKQAAMEIIPELNTAGYLIEDFGPAELVVKEVPSCFSEWESESFLDSVLNADELAPGIPELKKTEIISNACKAAVKAGDSLNPEEAKALLKDLDRCENPYSCPHGRPTFLRFTQKELERLFKR